MLRPSRQGLNIHLKFFPNAMLGFWGHVEALPTLVIIILKRLACGPQHAPCTVARGGGGLGGHGLLRRASIIVWPLSQSRAPPEVADKRRFSCPSPKKSDPCEVADTRQFPCGRRVSLATSSEGGPRHCLSIFQARRAGSPRPTIPLKI